MLWSLFIIWKLHRTRMIQRPAPLDAPVQEFCRIELDRLDRQIQLLRSVLWWYIAPLHGGCQHCVYRLSDRNRYHRIGNRSMHWELPQFTASVRCCWRGGIYALNMQSRREAVAACSR